MSSESSMKDFIQEHMTSILRPFADHVVELKSLVKQLREDLTETATLSTKNSHRLDLHDPRIATLEANCAKVRADFDALHPQFLKLRELHFKLDIDHNLTKENLVKTDQRHAALQGFVNELSALESDDRNCIAKLQRDLANTDSNAGKLARSHADLKTFTDGLHNRHEETVLTLAKTKQLAEDTHETLKSHISAADFRHRENWKAVSFIQDNWRNMEDMLSNSMRMLRKQAEDLEATSMEVNLLNCQINGGKPEDDDGPVRNHRIGTAPFVVKDRFDEIERNFRKIATSLESNIGSVHDLTQTVRGNTDVIQRNSGDIQSFVQVQSNHNIRINGLFQRTGVLEKRADVLTDRADVVDIDLTNLRTQSEQAFSNLRQHSEELDLVRAHQKRSDESLDDAHRGVQNLNVELGVTRGVVAKIDARLNLAHDYVQGLSKGFQDTHQKVVHGKEGMLVPMQTTTRTLPKIPGSLPPST
eukprot:TRINITY_DN30951_c0_g1_i1.p1 TRINITY_DN30951_c0_g1~~TRINITY_DN30951_c0_g1_i1.p1  ORF type:complete len:473 (+),score=93.97 TRINITY_DN30951_c0_g1_i1:91-1509(+)